MVSTTQCIDEHEQLHHGHAGSHLQVRGEVKFRNFLDILDICH